MMAIKCRIVPTWLGLTGMISSALLMLSMLVSTSAIAADDALAEAEIQALSVMEDFLTTFNARDEEAWADTLVFPHVRMASGTVVVYPTREEFVAAMDLDAFAANTTWRRSTWDDMRVIQSSSKKVHVQVTFSRFDENDDLIATFNSLYIIEPVDGRWGVRARSSFAP